MAGFGPFGRIVVLLHEKKAARDAFRACATEFFNREPTLTDHHKDVLLRRDPGQIRAAFIDENGGNDGTPGHVRATLLVNSQLNNPSDQ